MPRNRGSIPGYGRAFQKSSGRYLTSACRVQLVNRMRGRMIVARATACFPLQASRGALTMTSTKPFNVSLTKRDRQRKLRSGEIVINTRWVLNYSDPKTGQRTQLFFVRQKDAIAKRNE